jgi:hypothetical protein
MSGLRIVGLVLIVAGVLALVYRGFDYTKEKRATKLGPMEFTMKDQEHVEIPAWAGIGAVGIGVALLLLPPRRK